jgi:hypothetical protein
VSRKTLTTIGMIAGGWIGGSIPALWGDIGLSFSSLFFSAAGAMAGVYLGFRFGE